MKNTRCRTASGRHAWTAAPGGCKENPGVWGIGGAAILFRHVCSRCGAERESVVGDVDSPSRNHGWRITAGPRREN